MSEQEQNQKSIEELEQELQRKKLEAQIAEADRSIKGESTSVKNSALAHKLHSMKIWSIVSFVGIFFIIGIIPAVVLWIVYSIQILTTDWKLKEVNDNKLVWGLVTLLLLGVIGSLIFACINEPKYR